MAKAKANAAGPSRRPLTPSLTAQFKRDVKRQKKRGKNLDVLRAIIENLCARRSLDARYKDHPLRGHWTG
jgi:mRNA interferase YafQ